MESFCAEMRRRNIVHINITKTFSYKLQNKRCIHDTGHLIIFVQEVKTLIVLITLYVQVQLYIQCVRHTLNIITISKINKIYVS